MTVLDPTVGALASASRARLPALMFSVAILATSVARWPLLRVSGIPILWVDAAIVLVYLSLLLEFLRNRALPELDALIWPTAAFLLALGISCLGSPHPLRSMLKLTGFTPYLLLPVLGATIMR